MLCQKYPLSMWTNVPFIIDVAAHFTATAEGQENRLFIVKLNIECECHQLGS